MTATRTITRFVIALCPATPTYLHADTATAWLIEGKYTTADKSKARLFDTFDAAMKVAQDITGWGGAQRVEQVAVEVEDTRVTLDTPEARIEVRDAATCAWNECADCDCVTVHARHTEDYLRSVGLMVATIMRNGASCRVSINLADHLGNTLTLDWDPMQDGFAYETEGDDACDIGETEAQHEAEPDTVTCDGCGATDAEPCGDSEGFAFCAACRAKDSGAAFNPHDVDADAEGA